MSDDTRPSILSRLLGTSRPVGGPLLAITLAVGATAALFAYTAGWLSPDRITPAHMVNALSARGGDPVGHRRNHAKGICFTGYFEANGAGTETSTAAMLVAGRYPVIGRFAIAVGNPLADDGTGRVRSMAIRITTPDGQEWRSGMNSAPMFPVADPAAFYALTLASDIDPKTGKANPDAMKQFVAHHPEFGPFADWAKTAPWTASFADQSYNSVNAFVLTDKTDARHPVRWTMIPATPAMAVTPEDLKKLGPDFLNQDLEQRLGQTPLRWSMAMTFAAPGDPTDDATKVWPVERRTLEVGTLVVETVTDEANGACRDYNYDPTILPAGIGPSDDPLLAARSAAYANSFDRRAAEASYYPHTSANKVTK